MDRMWQEVIDQLKDAGYCGTPRALRAFVIEDLKAEGYRIVKLSAIETPLDGDMAVFDGSAYKIVEEL